jgi:TonB family protein
MKQTSVERIGRPQLIPSVGPTLASDRQAKATGMHRVIECRTCHLVALLIAILVGCAPRMRQPNAKAPSATRVVMRALAPEAASAVLTVQAPCPTDLSLRALTCPAQSAVMEVVVSAEGRVTRSRVARSSGSQVLDAACILAAYSCVIGPSSQQGALECSLQCE